jgi:hypothetical protein
MVGLRGQEGECGNRQGLGLLASVVGFSILFFAVGHGWSASRRADSKKDASVYQACGGRAHDLSPPSPAACGGLTGRTSRRRPVYFLLIFHYVNAFAAGGCHNAGSCLCFRFRKVSSLRC